MKQSTTTQYSAKTVLSLFMACAVLMVISMPEAHAGGGGSAFDDVWQTLTDWTQGTLGRIIAGGMVIVGIVAGIARQSLMSFALGIGGGMGLYNTPTVIESILTATLPVVSGLPLQ
jgi:conjugal transfer pilus assembly protein TraA